MATNFPTSLDTSTNLPSPVGSDLLANANPKLAHATLHDTVSAAILALENKVGINESTVPTSLDYLTSHFNGANVSQSTQTPIPDSTNTILSFDTTIFDSNGYLSGGVLTAPETGYYQSIATIDFLLAGIVTASISLVGVFLIRASDSHFIAFTNNSLPIGTQVGQVCNLSGIVHLNAGDSVNVRIRQNTGSTVNISTGTLCQQSIQYLGQ